MSRQYVSVVVLLTSILLVVALSGFANVGHHLDGTNWWLVRWNSGSLDPQAFEINAEFKDDRIWGSSGTNLYGGKAQVGPGAKFSVSEFLVTQIAGPQLEERAETVYHQLLRATESYRLSERTLTQPDAAGSELLVFRCVNR